MTTQEVLQQCTVEGNVVKLPAQQLDRKLYQDVAKALQLIGGKWTGGKVFGFVFPADPTEFLEQIVGGEARNLKKEFQFFATPDSLANELVSYANLLTYHRILEPSAGQGAIIKAIHKVAPTMVDYCELMPTNRMFLEKIPFTELVREDFFEMSEVFGYDRIVANPPFQKNQDILHIRKMYNLLNPGGRLVTMASTHWVDSQNQKETSFRNWLEKVHAEVIDVEAGAFKESGTNIPTKIIIINKN